MLLVLLLWIGLAGTQQAQHHISTGQRVKPCFEDDAVAALREALQADGALSNSSLTLFGTCRAPDHATRSALLVLSEEMQRKTGVGLEVLHPAAAFAAEEQGVVSLTIDFPSSPSLELNPVLLLAFESPPTVGDLEVTFSSRFLQPHSQSACISEGTLYVLLKGRSSSSSSQDIWRISVEAKSTEMNQNLIDAIVGGKSGGLLGVTPLLIFLEEAGTNGSVPVQTSFFCELRRFLGSVLPQDQTKQPLLQLSSLQSLPPLPLGLSSSETLLAALINSSAPTIFYFNNWGTKFQGHLGQLTLSPVLWAELRLRLEQNEMLIQDLVKDERVSPRTRTRLERLKDLGASQQMEAAERHFCAFLLLKALQTVAHAHDMKRQLRRTRAGPDSPSKDNICGLRSLTVSFEKLFLSPQSANINNCRGVCTFPLINGNNHAVLLTSHAESAVGERAPCCVPVAYDPLEVVDWNDEGSFLSIKPDMIARECGCR